MPHEYTIPTDGARLEGYTVWDGYGIVAHWPGCYRDPGHHACALAEIERLKALAAQEAQRADTITQDTAKRHLLTLMESLSESCWAASWMLGTERDLWRAMELKEAQPWGMGVIEAEELEDLRQLSALANGWWVWDRDEREPVFVPLADMGNMPTFLRDRAERKIDIPSVTDISNPLEI